METNHEYLGTGAYTAKEAARLLRFSLRQTRTGARRPALTSSTLSRWLTPTQGEPLWNPHFGGDEQGLHVTFRELIELRFVAAFRSAGLSLQTIRQCIRRAIEVTGDSMPFSNAKFRTDGKTIFLRAEKQFDEPALLDLKRNQFAFNRAIEPSFRDLVFEHDVAARWDARKSGRNVIALDPARSFGAPVSETSGIPAAALAQAAISEGGAKNAAWAFDVAESEIKAAVAFQMELAAA
jgi:hypothetical protein